MAMQEADNKLRRCIIALVLTEMRMFRRCVIDRKLAYMESIRSNATALAFKEVRVSSQAERNATPIEKAQNRFNSDGMSQRRLSYRTKGIYFRQQCHLK